MMKSRIKEIEMQEFVIQYIKENLSTSVVDKEFHDAFAIKFGYKQQFKMWGAKPCRKAMQILKNLYDANILDKKRISICGGEGFPTWVYVYDMKAVK